MKIKDGWQIIKTTFSDFMDDKALRLAAAMAYYTVFSIGPLLVLLIGIAGLMMDAEDVRTAVSDQVKANLGGSSEQMVMSMMSSQERGGSLMATIIGGVALVLGASGVFGQLQDALNTIWEVKNKPGGGIWGFVRTRFLSMAMVLGTGFLLLVSMVLSSVLASSSEYLERQISMPAWVAFLLHLGVSLAVITLLFAMIFKVLPDVKIRWNDVWVGAFATAVLFVIGKFGLSFYLGKQGSESAYGAATGLILILLYVYYSSVILFLGAEFTQVYARRYGERIVPSEHAEFISEDAAQRGTKSSLPESGSSRPGKVAPQPAYAHAQAFGSTQGPLDYYTAHQSMTPSSSFKTGATLRPGVGHAPVERLRAHRSSYIGLAVTAGVAATLLWRFKFLRKALKAYMTARRYI